MSNIPTITNEHVDQQIMGAQFYRFPGTNVIVCCLTLRNGFAVTGQSSCVHPALFDEARGKEIAFNNARNEIWELEGYLLKDFLHSQEDPPVVDLTDAMANGVYADIVNKDWETPWSAGDTPVVIERIPGGDSTGLPD